MFKIFTLPYQQQTSQKTTIVVIMIATQNPPLSIHNIPTRLLLQYEPCKNIPITQRIIHCSKKTFRNMLLHDIDALLHYYSINYFTCLSTTNNPEPISLPGDCSGMAQILANFTLLFIETDACTPHIIQSVWGVMTKHKWLLVAHVVTFH